MSTGRRRKSKKNSNNKPHKLRQYINQTYEEAENNKGDNSINIYKSIERNKYVLDLVNLWIGNADNKIDFAFAILSAILGLVVYVTENLFSNIKYTTVNNGLYVCFELSTIIALLVFGLAIFFYIHCIIPRFNNDKDKKKKYSIFYDNIKDFDDYQNYVDVCKNISDEVFNEEIVKEIYFNSRICSKKMRSFRFAIIMSGLSILFAIISAILYYMALIL